MRLSWMRQGLVALTAGALGALLLSGPAAAQTPPGENRLVGRSILPALTFSPGPTSGRQTTPANGVTPPYVNAQPIQGFSGVIDNGDGTFLVMPDNGFGALENSADFNLRVYRIRPEPRTPDGSGDGNIDVLSNIELRDPDNKVPFAITNHFTTARVLTGADFDLESIQRTPDGTLWFGDEFGPYVIHTDATGKVLDPPIALPDTENGGEVRSLQNPRNEESSAVRIMNALRERGRSRGVMKDPVFSPADTLLDDGNPATVVPNRASPPAGSGLAPASSEILNVASLKSAGYKVVPYTVNDPARMRELLALGVSGIISDRPDLLLAEVRAYDGPDAGSAPDFILPDGRIDGTLFDAQGHRGARNLRPESTLPAFEAALDNLMPTLETDAGLSSDRTPILDHDPIVNSQKCRRSDGSPYGPADHVLVRDLTAAQLQSQFICDKTFRDPSQVVGDPTNSPVATSFATGASLDLHAMPTVQNLFDFVARYVAYYETGAGAGSPGAAAKAANARVVRFNLETKINPRAEFAARTLGVNDFADRLVGVIVANSLTARADVQSFDWRTLLRVQDIAPSIRVVGLLGDFPKYDDPSIPGSDEGTNLQPEAPGGNTPWLAGLPWPYRVTKQAAPFRAQRSGGFEGMAQSPDGTKLYPLLELPLTGAPAKTLLISELDVATRSYTGRWWTYLLDPRGTNIGDFTIFGDGTKGLVVERDGTQGDLNGFKQVFEITFGPPGTAVGKGQVLDLLSIPDPDGISAQDQQAGDVGIGPVFAFPFVTIEDVVVLGPRRIGILNDNNFPGSKGRHLGTGAPDDNEMIIVDLAQPLGTYSELPPAPVVPEAPFAALLPLTAFAAVALLFMRRRLTAA